MLSEFGRKEQRLAVEILKNVQASCQPTQPACLLQSTSLQKQHVEQVSWGHRSAARLTLRASRANRLQLFTEEPQEPESSTRSLVFSENSRRFRCMDERRSDSGTVRWERTQSANISILPACPQHRVWRGADFETHICGQVRGSQFLSQDDCRGSARAGTEKKNTLEE
ncbi:hypothetical protein Baya_12525 [Bagarius yarrelli]|uniref:Uncharacterized protein n=1 Tax=Bagarius yarrelli TaxID=175774 RepID=A0A556V3H5_BAGYA|nr:hypothetical protein Baya_12525 [Bagarius yarrelli]